MNAKRSEIKARILTVRMPISEVGFFNSLIDGLDRIALTRTRKKGEGVVDIIASPDRFDELIKIVEGMKKHVKDLEIIGESSFEELNF
ncbi:MAG: DUF4911 domain-containing protein [Aquificae bacterium]|nr:DUF4911 domain-containing protein [Aquificota bacterium]